MEERASNPIICVFLQVCILYNEKCSWWYNQVWSDFNWPQAGLLFYGLKFDSTLWSTVLVLWNCKSSKMYTNVSNSVCIFIFNWVLSPHVWNATSYPRVKRYSWQSNFWRIWVWLFLFWGLFFFVTILLLSPTIELSFYYTLILTVTGFSISV